jgi:hypothetical protein
MKGFQNCKCQYINKKKKKNHISDLKVIWHFCGDQLLAPNIALECTKVEVKEITMESNFCNIK